MKPTQEQLKAIQGSVEDNLVTISALPGTGKTTTIVEIIRKIQSVSRGTILTTAYNKDIQMSIQKKLNDSGLNAECQTIHSIGFEILRERNKYKKIYVNAYKHSNAFKRFLLKNNVDETFVDALPFRKIELVLKMMQENLNESSDAICVQYNLSFDDENVNINHFIDAYYELNVEGCMKEIYGEYKFKNYPKTGYHIPIDFDDMVFIPVIKKLSPITKYKYIIVDEAQDLSPLKIKLLESLLYENGTMIFLGDRNQCINQYAGSSSMLFDDLCSRSANYSLTYTMRCSKSIVSYVNTIHPDIDFKAFHLNKDGEVMSGNKQLILDKLNSIDKSKSVFIMNTKNLPLFEIYLMLLRNGYVANLQGNDVTDYIDDLFKKQTDIQSLKNVIRMRLGYQFKKIKRTYPDLTNRQVLAHQNYQQHFQPIKIMYEISKHFFNADIENENPVIDLKLIKSKIHEVYSDKNKSNITLMSCHKSKGREADYVFITDYEDMYNHKTEQDKFLSFTALTRGIDSLYLIETEKKKVVKDESEFDDDDESEFDDDDESEFDDDDESE